MIWIEGVLVSEGAGGVYGERILQGYRVWDPYRSKLAAMYYLGAGPELRPDQTVLYLGAANGTTVSHVADYTSVVYAVEYAPRPMQDLLEVARRRKNIVPIMADATRPMEYAPLMESVDLVYQDVAQPGQVSIALNNAVFLKPGGNLVLVLKTRSIDVSRSPPDILAEAEEALRSGGLQVRQSVWLTPYHQDHAALICARD
ncbi:fibrillarin-like pre-rRNA processing protein [Methanolinea mesophila]|uniref:fibrillarin-like rRNA/tRNA 2'-O-methyltransferase n=1 Tax=Methanolinea mesophila TaxID=547055 RepID=UPI001AE9C16A|nr:fibrillarin-like rRNA/tRNA 2'-O-methyltransferase [Methanolinea mesophila]MBP1928551.1 fibrillarin-like pre-rRNA processing protein [Methanolinea mesophila]